MMIRKEDIIKLISLEGFEFVIDKKAAMVSRTIRNMLTSPGSFAETEHGEVTFPEISTTTFSRRSASIFIGLSNMPAISVEDIRSEVKILRALSGHKNLVKFYDAFENDQNVYIAMELCEGGELLDRILARGGRDTEDDAKTILIQMLSVAAFCNLQGVVHHDLKPENFLFTTRDENAPMKVIDFGLSDFIWPDQRLNDIVGSVYYVAPEVLHRSYNAEADMWSIGVITYILLCGRRPFWARTE